MEVTIWMYGIPNLPWFLHLNMRLRIKIGKLTIIWLTIVQKRYMLKLLTSLRSSLCRSTFDTKKCKQEWLDLQHLLDSFTSLLVLALCLPFCQQEYISQIACWRWHFQNKLHRSFETPKNSKISSTKICKTLPSTLVLLSSLKVQLLSQYSHQLSSVVHELDFKQQNYQRKDVSFPSGNIWMNHDYR